MWFWNFVQVKKYLLADEKIFSAADFYDSEARIVGRDAVHSVSEGRLYVKPRGDADPGRGVGRNLYVPLQPVALARPLAAYHAAGAVVPRPDMVQVGGEAWRHVEPAEAAFAVGTTYAGQILVVPEQ